MSIFAVRVQPFVNRYCPCCLAPVDPVSGEHWNGCEYEASYGTADGGIWVNPEQPLTELEMLTMRLVASKANLKDIRKSERKTKARIAELEALVQSKS